MSDMTDFLLARIAEDEMEARDELPNIVDSDFLFKWQPRRVLAECEAKRQMVESFFVVENAEFHADAWTVMKSVLRFLALPYADHPDYRAEWRP